MPSPEEHIKAEVAQEQEQVALDLPAEYSYYPIIIKGVPVNKCKPFFGRYFLSDIIFSNCRYQELYPGS